MYTEVELKDGREGTVVSRLTSKTDPRIQYLVDTEDETMIEAFEEDFISVGEWEEDEVEQD